MCRWRVITTATARTDLAVWRASDGTWYILKSSDNYNQATYLSYQWGLNSDVPVSSVSGILRSIGG